MANGNGNNEVKDSFITAKLGGVAEWRAPLIRFTRYQAVFEIRAPEVAVRASEVIEDFKIVALGNAVYSGRAVVSNIVFSGSAATCEVALAENGWIAMERGEIGKWGAAHIAKGFNDFVGEWQKLYLVREDYKIAVADLQTFLADLRLWLDQVEVGIRSAPVEDQAKIEIDVANELRSSVTNALTSMFERFEAVAQRVEPEIQPAHRAFVQRQLHPYLLCAPFVHRIYAKPLGYAGDCFMIDMIMRNEFEGGSLYAKLVHSFVLNQIPARAVRNRARLLEDRLVAEVSRVAASGRKANVFNLACGPAWELQYFFRDHGLCEHANYDLLDFNDETLRYAEARLNEVKNRHHRQMEMRFIRNSVQNLLRPNAKFKSGRAGYDLIYISGLYDYLNDHVIVALNTYLYDQLLPGGKLVVGNFGNNNIIGFQEQVTEWFLIYRNARQMASLGPRQVPREECKIVAEEAAANIFLEVRKPG